MREGLVRYVGKRRGEGMLVGILEDKETHIAQLRARHPEFFGGVV